MQIALDITWQIGLITLFLFEWVFRLVMLFIVPRKRNPSSATAWLLFIMIVPFLGTLLFLLIGSPKLNKIRRARQQKADSKTAHEIKSLKNGSAAELKVAIAESYLQIATLAEKVGGLPPLSGNSVSVETEYGQIMQRQADLIDQAKEYVHLEYFILVMDDQTECIFAALERARARGITVLVLFDFVSRFYPNYKKMLKRLKEVDIVYHRMLPMTIIPSRNFNRPDLRNHRKLLVVDGFLGSIGSANLVTSSYHRKDELRYIEMAFMLEGPIVWQLDTVFRADWYAETAEYPKHTINKKQLPAGVGKTTLQALPSGPGSTHENNLLVYTQLFYSAKQKITIAVPYFVPDESLLSALIAAARRGVIVTVINSEIKDKLLVGHAQRSFYDELLEAGINIYLYKKPIFLHNKQVTVDDSVAVIGSSNLDIRSFELNQELSMIIYDKPVLSRLHEVEQEYIRHATKITHEKWRARSKSAKFLDSVARITSALQ